jgi:hypothetical protein
MDAVSGLCVDQVDCRAEGTGVWSCKLEGKEYRWTVAEDTPKPYMKSSEADDPELELRVWVRRSWDGLRLGGEGRHAPMLQQLGP